MPATDHELLLQHHAGDKAAFAELTSRHIHWIYSAALRRAKNPQLAEDITQAVLLALATNRRALSAKLLAAWIFGVVRYSTASALRSESRRWRHETAAAQLQQSQNPTPSAMSTTPDWQSLAPQLEDAVAALPTADRQLILLRFYQQLSFAQVASALGITESAARQRLGRALGKLRARFLAANLAISAESLGGIILQNCTHPAPAHLAASPASAHASDLFRSWLRHLRRRLVVQFATVAAALVVIAAVTTELLVDHQPSPARVQNIPLTEAAPAPAPAPATVDAATRPSDMTFAQVIAAIKQTEHLFQNVHVKNFQTTTEHQPSGQVAWTPTPVRYTGSACFDADPEGQARQYLTSEVLPRASGTSPLMEQIVDRSWDGKHCVQLELAQGNLGQLHRIASAQITRERPLELGPYYRQFAGLGFTAQYYFMYEELSNPPQPRPTFSEMLQSYAKRLGKPPDVWQQTINGLSAIRLHYHREVPGKLSADFSYWFAPSRGFAYLKEESILNEPNFSKTESTDVLAFRQLAPNIWFPTRVTWIKRAGIKGGYMRYTYRANDITVNDPNFDPKIFHPAIPTAWVVDDFTGPARQNYFTMPDGSHLQLHPGTDIPHIKPAVSTRPDGDDPPITHEGWAAW